MQQQVKIWHLLLSFLIGIISCATMVFSTGMRSGEWVQKTKMTLDYHQQQINEMKVNADVDRREARDRWDRINNDLTEIKLMLKDKADREN